MDVTGSAKLYQSGIRCSDAIQIQDRHYHWHILYVRGLFEKKIEKQIAGFGIETFLPLIQKREQWSDRIHQTETPAFPSYLFVRLSFREYLRVLSVPNVLKFVTMGGKPQYIGEEVLKNIRIILSSHQEYRIIQEPLFPDQRVRIISGPLAGCMGGVIRSDRNSRVIISLEEIHYSITVRIDQEAIQPLAL